VLVSCVVNAGRVELFTDVPGGWGFWRDVPVSTPASGCVRVVVGRPVSTTVGRVGRGVLTGCRCVTIVSCQRQQGLLRCVVGNESTQLFS